MVVVVVGEEEGLCLVYLSGEFPLNRPHDARRPFSTVYPMKAAG